MSDDAVELVAVVGDPYRTVLARKMGPPPPYMARQLGTDRDDLVELAVRGPMMTVAYRLEPHGAGELAAQLNAAADRPVVDVTEVLVHLEGRYEATLQAIVHAHPENTADVERWRGHAEMARQTCEMLRATAGLPAVDMTSAAWRAERGIPSG